MPIVQSIVHYLDKSADDQSTTLNPTPTPMSGSEAMDALLNQFNATFNGKTKGWGHFNGADDSGVFAHALGEYLAGNLDFVAFTQQGAERFRTLVDEHLPTGGPLLFVHARQGEAEFLTVALLHYREGFTLDEQGNVTTGRQLNLNQMTLAVRIDLTQWQAGQSKQYIAFTRDRGGKKLSEDFQAFLGCTEGVDATSETRTLLKAFSDYVESESMDESQSREKTDAVIDYASDQSKRGESITLEEFSSLVNDERPDAFYDYIRNKDYGLSPEIPPDKRTLQQFRRFTGRAGGMSISFDSHLLGDSIEYNEAQDRLIIKKVPDKLKAQLLDKRS
ncbi:nucleoid-associated protein YejK [uncultured Kushneria sp.]|uniref:nucleoid-associated protein YejK n=1 Tax=uncultured Kushneria sp. TaxID=905033 RepID=UPI0026193887|nr:nucleoid-associated protein YejK [uncultured Kushneria sp.]